MQDIQETTLEKLAAFELQLAESAKALTVAQAAIHAEISAKGIEDEEEVMTPALQRYRTSLSELDLELSRGSISSATTTTTADEATQLYGPKRAPPLMPPPALPRTNSAPAFVIPSRLSTASRNTIDSIGFRSMSPTGSVDGNLYGSTMSPKILEEHETLVRLGLLLVPAPGWFSLNRLSLPAFRPLPQRRLPTLRMPTS